MTQPVLPTLELTARVSAGIAGLACVLLQIDRLATFRVPAWLRRSVAVALLLAGVTAHFHFFSIPAREFFHRWEMFHYVLGAKYAPELGYELLYSCVAVADADNGHAADVASRQLRDLRNDRLVAGSDVLRDAQACRARFSAPRWAAFGHDVAFFRDLAGSDDTWSRMQQDHGYNPSPIWTLTGHPLASFEPLTESLLRRLACVDLGLLIATGGLLLWGFGWRIAWLAALFWSTQAPADFGWTGAAFMRQDWLLLAVASLVFARKRWFFAAGGCLMWCALLRVFPLLLLLGACCTIAARFVRNPSSESARGQRRFLAGALCSAGILVAASTLSGASATTYSGFAKHLYMHSQTQIVNHMSLRTLWSFAPNGRIAALERAGSAELAQDWEQARINALRARRGLYVVSAIALLLWSLRCLWGLRTLWVAIAVSLLLVMTLSDPSCYYYSMFVLAAVLARARRGIEVMLMGLAAASQLLALRFALDDDRFAAMSGLYLLFSCAIVLLFSRPLRRAPLSPHLDDNPGSPSIA